MTAAPTLKDVATRDLAAELVTRLKLAQPNEPVLAWRARYARAIDDVLDAVDVLDSIPGALDAAGTPPPAPDFAVDVEVMPGARRVPAEPGVDTSRPDDHGMLPHHP